MKVGSAHHPFQARRTGSFGASARARSSQSLFQRDVFESRAHAVALAPPSPAAKDIATQVVNVVLRLVQALADFLKKLVPPAPAPAEPSAPPPVDAPAPVETPPAPAPVSAEVSFRRLIDADVKTARGTGATQADYDYWLPKLMGPNDSGLVTSGAMTATEYWHRRLLGWQVGGSDVALYGPYAGDGAQHGPVPSAEEVVPGVPAAGVVG